MYLSTTARLFFASLALLAGFAACTPSTDTEPDTPNTGPLTPPPVESFEKVEINEAKFSDRMDDLLAGLFPDYKEEKMQAVDQTPKFKEANRSIYRKFRRTEPIEIALSKSAYPRLSVKAFRFSKPSIAQKVAVDWLGSHEHSGDSIVLGEEIEALKSPPHFCALYQSELFLIQTSCIYQHATYDEMRTRFEAWAKGVGVDMAWEITCAAGKTVWMELE